VRIISIDPGLSGAVALHVDGILESVTDMPVVSIMRGKTQKRQVSAQGLATLIIDLKADHAVIEKVSAMPGQGVSSMFSFGRSAGVIEGVLAALMVPQTFVQPAVWTRAITRGIGKDASRSRAMELYPSHQKEFARAKDDGRADAVLIGFWYLRELTK